VLTASERERFDALVLPQLSAAFTLARYLTRDHHDAEDVVQEAFLRAMKHFAGFRGDDERGSRAWLLTIVRNTAYTRRQRHKAEVMATEFDEVQHSESIADEHPEAALSRSAAKETLAKVLDTMPPEMREVIVLRELQGLSYDEMSEVIGVPVGTVMSRLSRARKRLQAALIASNQGELR
jgi:RNA polymerase sigma-70 factor (ECF subfamily)